MIWLIPGVVAAIGVIAVLAAANVLAGEIAAVRRSLQDLRAVAPAAADLGRDAAAVKAQAAALAADARGRRG